MRVNAKDALATLVLAAGGAFYAWHLARPDTAFVGSLRWTSVVLFVVGVTACAIGARLTASGRYERFMSSLAAVPFLLMLAVLVTDNEGVLGALAGVIAAMWLVTTVRHALGVQPATPAPTTAPQPRELQPH
jgi:hypothetical protein